MSLFYLKLLLLTLFTSLFTVAPQDPEIKDQFDKTPDKPEEQSDKATEPETTVFIRSANTAAKPVEIENIALDESTNLTIGEIESNEDKTEIIIRSPKLAMNESHFLAKIYTILSAPLRAFVSAPRVNAVLRNIGTCIVNGAMELITHYLPTPLIPLIASAAGMVIPFEPVVMLRNRMPVTSYRRALKSAVNSFVGTFDKYKADDNFDDDPYMTLRFNRRFMGSNKFHSNEEPKNSKE